VGMSCIRTNNNNKDTDEVFDDDSNDEEKITNVPTEPILKEENSYIVKTFHTFVQLCPEQVYCIQVYYGHTPWFVN
jgi:hypothetical protein